MAATKSKSKGEFSLSCLMMAHTAWLCSIHPTVIAINYADEINFHIFIEFACLGCNAGDFSPLSLFSNGAIYIYFALVRLVASKNKAKGEFPLPFLMIYTAWLCRTVIAINYAD